MRVFKQLRKFWFYFFWIKGGFLLLEEFNFECTVLNFEYSQKF